MRRAILAEIGRKMRTKREEAIICALCCYIEPFFVSLCMVVALSCFWSECKGVKGRRDGRHVVRFEFHTFKNFVILSHLLLFGTSDANALPPRLRSNMTSTLILRFLSSQANLRWR